MNKSVISLYFILILLCSTIIFAQEEGDFNQDNMEHYGITGEGEVKGTYQGGILTIDGGTVSELNTASKGISEAKITACTVKLGGNPYPAQNLEKISMSGGVIKGTAGSGAVIGEYKIPAGKQFEMSANGKIKVYGLSTAQSPDVSIGETSFKTGGDGFEYDPATKTVKPLGKSSFTLADGSNIGLKTPASYFVIDNGQVKEAYLEKDSFYRTGSNLGNQYIRAANGNLLVKPGAQGIPTPPNGNTAALNIDTSSGKPVYNINTPELSDSNKGMDLRISFKLTGQENPDYVLQFGTSSKSGDTTLTGIGSSRYNDMANEIVFNTPSQKVTIDEEATNINRVDPTTRSILSSQEAVPAPGLLSRKGRSIAEWWNGLDTWGLTWLNIPLEERLTP